MRSDHFVAFTNTHRSEQSINRSFPSISEYNHVLQMKAWDKRYNGCTLLRYTRKECNFFQSNHYQETTNLSERFMVFFFYYMRFFIKYFFQRLVSYTGLYFEGHSDTSIEIVVEGLTRTYGKRLILSSRCQYKFLKTLVT